MVASSEWLGSTGDAICAPLGRGPIHKITTPSLLRPSPAARPALRELGPRHRPECNHRAQRLPTSAERTTAEPLVCNRLADR